MPSIRCSGVALSPFGELYLAASTHGICRVSWTPAAMVVGAAREAEGARGGPHRVLGCREECDGARGIDRGHENGSEEGPAARLLRDAACQLGEYFDRRRQRFELPLDLSRLRPFPRRVLTALLQVPYGEVVSYGELAVLAGHPGAARAVGSAMRGNPLPILIPCHRVVLGSGALGGFGGRPDLKRRLLELEGWSAATLSRAFPFK